MYTPIGNVMIYVGGMRGEMTGWQGEFGWGRTNIHMNGCLPCVPPSPPPRGGGGGGAVCIHAGQDTLDHCLPCGVAQGNFLMLRYTPEDIHTCTLGPTHKSMGFGLLMPKSIGPTPKLIEFGGLHPHFSISLAEFRLLPQTVLIIHCS